MAFPWEFDWHWRAAVLDELQRRGFALPDGFTLRGDEAPRDVHGVAMMRGWGHVDYGPNTGQWRMSLDCYTWRKLPKDWPSRWIVEAAADYVQERVELPLLNGRPARWFEGSWWCDASVPSLAEVEALGRVPVGRVRREVLALHKGFELYDLSVGYHRGPDGACDGLTVKVRGEELFVPAASVKAGTSAAEIVAWIDTFAIEDFADWDVQYGSREETVGAARELARRYVEYHVSERRAEFSFVDLAQADRLVRDDNTLDLEDKKQVEKILFGVLRAKWYARWETEEKIADVESRFVEAGYVRDSQGVLVRGEDWVLFELDHVRGEVTVRFSPGGMLDFETGRTPWGVGYAVNKAAWANGWPLEDRRTLVASIPGIDAEFGDLNK